MFSYFERDLDIIFPFVEIIEVAECYLPPYVLGMTNCRDRVWIRKNLGYNMKKMVLIHELEHIKNPSASEYTIGEKTRARLNYIT